MDARTERAISSTRRTATIHRRSGAFRTSNPLGARQPHVRRHRAGRPAGEAPRAALVVMPVHEGLRLGRQGARPLAAIVARIPLAAVVRAPMDELLPGDRADLSRGRGGLRRHLSGA